MRRMSEVFNGKPCGFSTRMTDEQVRHGQHAINHIDALADALEMLMDWNVKNVTIEHHPIYDIAHSALAAYRGDK